MEQPDGRPMESGHEQTGGKPIDQPDGRPEQAGGTPAMPG